jgi:glyoxylase-like metal-dependent hydrolase (beta-lactamase superfamily II)
LQAELHFSHGFDANGTTTGFIIWINGNGVVVDPPVQTTQYLRANGIKNSFVHKVILTHCHSDHDSGLLKKILAEEKIELYTTKTIHESYKRKVRAITGLDITDYYRFTPVPIGKPFLILGATFEFDYSFHTIPTLRFKVNFGEKSISYSSDTLYDPVVCIQCVK